MLRLFFQQTSLREIQVVQMDTTEYGPRMLNLSIFEKEHFSHISSIFIYIRNKRILPAECLVHFNKASHYTNMGKPSWTGSRSVLPIWK